MTASVGARGPGRNAPEASVGFPLASGGGGAYFPRPIYGEISALRFQAFRFGPRALESLGLGDTPFFKELKCEALAKVFFCGSTSSPRTEKLNNFKLSPFTLSLSKGKLRTFARSSCYFYFYLLQLYLCVLGDLCG